jgi:hypothetical protein
MKHEYKDVKITTFKDKQTRKWGASFALPMDNGDTITTSPLYKTEEKILIYVKSQIDTSEKLANGEDIFNFPND